MTKDEALNMAIEFIDEITNAAGKYPYVDKTSLVADSYAMASKLKEALEQPAQKHLCTYSRAINQQYPRKCIHCGKVEALAQPAQEPVAERFLMKDKGKSYWAYSDYDNSKDWQPLYTHPAPSWQGLSDDEIDKLYADWERGQTDYLNYARAIEQALKEKNNAV